MSLKLSKKHGLNPMLGQCPICSGPTNEIFLLGQIKGDAEAPHHGVVPGRSEPCSECDRMMDMGLLLVVCRDGSDEKNPFRLGEMHVLKPGSAARIFGDSLGDKRVAFIEESLARQIGLKKPEVKTS